MMEDINQRFNQQETLIWKQETSLMKFKGRRLMNVVIIYLFIYFWDTLLGRVQGGL
jgi:hypothetical protein